eukprot:scaffold299890_cov36-Tisochrysis_lutea.AAC.2
MASPSLRPSASVSSPSCSRICLNSSAWTPPHTKREWMPAAFAPAISCSRESPICSTRSRLMSGPSSASAASNAAV